MPAKSTTEITKSCWCATTYILISAFPKAIATPSTFSNLHVKCCPFTQVQLKVPMTPIVQLYANLLAQVHTRTPIFLLPTVACNYNNQNK